jgi:hypothetical protein
MSVSIEPLLQESKYVRLDNLQYVQPVNEVMKGYDIDLAW